MLFLVYVILQLFLKVIIVAVYGQCLGFLLDGREVV